MSAVRRSRVAHFGNTVPKCAQRPGFSVPLIFQLGFHCPQKSVGNNAKGTSADVYRSRGAYLLRTEWWVCGDLPLCAQRPRKTRSLVSLLAACLGCFRPPLAASGPLWCPHGEHSGTRRCSKQPLRIQLNPRKLWQQPPARLVSSPRPPFSLKPRLERPLKFSKSRRRY